MIQDDSKLIVFGSNDNKYSDKRVSSLFSINLKNGEKVDLNINQVAFNSQPNLNFLSHITLPYTSKGVSFIADISLKNSKLKVLYGKESKINQIAYGNSNEKVFKLSASIEISFSGSKPLRRMSS